MQSLFFLVFNGHKLHCLLESLDLSWKMEPTFWSNSSEHGITVPGNRHLCSPLVPESCSEHKENPVDDEDHADGYEVFSYEAQRMIPVLLSPVLFLGRVIYSPISSSLRRLQTSAAQPSRARLAHELMLGPGPTGRATHQTRPRLRLGFFLAREAEAEGASQVLNLCPAESNQT
ncbi:hypothetical protein PAHAL_4G333300 [Panicum hallii]|uniref:Uncharacterized protein n=1 Tax=Panicum hallii TaxID=206008 RepID=A0A2T8JEV3_9POAL|nr:hypothetical protein PAHAL_4G333300 [Panicum hallii]